MVDLTDRWALVTGASRGVGRVVAGALADAGCRLIVHSRTLEHTASLVAELEARGTAVRALEAELSDQEQVVRLAAAALEISGGIDVLYNVAGVQARFREDVFETDAADYALCFQVNAIAPITLCNLLLPGMIERGFGRVVNVTSGIRDQPQLMAYAASKAALDKYVYDMAPHLRGSGVCMNLLDPGWLRTDMGGPNAPNDVASVLPGALVPVLLDEDVSGRWFSAQDYTAG